MLRERHRPTPSIPPRRSRNEGRRALTTLACLAMLSVAAAAVSEPLQLPLHALPSGIAPGELVATVLTRLHAPASSAAAPEALRTGWRATASWSSETESDAGGWAATAAGEVQTLHAQLAGLPVFESVARLHRDRQGNWTWLVLSPGMDVGSWVMGDGSDRSSPADRLWTIDPHQARAHAARHLSAPRSPGERGLSVSRVWFPEGGALRPAYQVICTADEGRDAQLLLLDGADGTLIERRGLCRRMITTGSGFVFDPNPVVSSGDRSLRDGDDVDPWRVEVDLPDLDGGGLLCGLWASIQTLGVPAFSPQHRFFYSARDLHFEEVMAYYHVTSAQRRVQSLGFNRLNAVRQKVVVHATGYDDSWYNMLTNTIHLGDGGVDDAEDADIILHEYGHALVDAAVGGTASGEPEALAEAMADYFAASWTGDPSVGDWDGVYRAGGCLRRVDLLLRYPHDMTGEPHADGLIWAGLLWRLRERVGATLGDALALEMLYYLTPQSGLPGAARALMAAANGLAQNRQADGLVAQIEDLLGECGFLPRRGRCSLTAGEAAQRTIPLGFSFAGPGAGGSGWADTVLVAADGSLRLQPAGDPTAAAQAPGTLPQLAALRAQPTAPGHWVHDSLQVTWEGTLWRMELEIRFFANDQVIRRATARLAADGTIEVDWHGEGSQAAFPCVVGWLPQGTDAPLTWIRLPEERTVHPAAGEGVAAALTAEPFALAGAAWEVVPGDHGAYRAELTRVPIPQSTGAGDLHPFPSPVRPGGRVVFRIATPGVYEVELLDPTGRRVTSQDLGALDPGLHELDLDALTPAGPPLPSGVYFLRLSGGNATRWGRILLLR